MILSTHAIVGGALASLLPSHPLMAMVAGFASHFAIDAIPHRDYRLQSIVVTPGHRQKLKLNRPFFQDLLVISLDASAGLALAIVFFVTGSNNELVILGAVAAMLPDPLRFVHNIYPHEPLNSLQEFHRWIHAKRQLDWPTGAGSQILVVATVIGVSALLR